jgi:hypothetical protein
MINRRLWFWGAYAVLLTAVTIAGLGFMMPSMREAR